ncbi:hypothetical protein [Bartonella sp. ML70XJBT.G]|nr:hypothetical protein [Bartonella sp. ML70XJBT.G]
MVCAFGRAYRCDGELVRKQKVWGIKVRCWWWSVDREAWMVGN